MTTEKNDLESVKDCERAVQCAISDGSIYLQQCAVDYDTRHCLWAGQSDDGRKRRDHMDKEPFPWEGASDTKIRLADEIVNDEVRVLRAAMARLTVQADMLKASQAPETAAYGKRGREMMAALFDPTQEEAVAAWLSEMYEALGPKAARRAVRQLRTKGETTVPETHVVRMQPLWTACRVMRDVFFPANTYDIQKSPWVAFREPITPEVLRSRVLTDDYDEDAVEDAIARCVGKTMLDHAQMANERASKAVVEEMDGLLEVFHFWTKTVDEQGFLRMEVRCFVPGIPEPLKEYESEYRLKEYPCVEFVRDRTERIILDNRSTPGLVDSHQTEVKTHRDFRADRASIAILPPVKVPMSRAAARLKFGPAAQIPERRPGEITWMTPPQMDMDTVGLERQVRSDADNYFGRMVEGVSPQRQQLYGQSSVDDFLSGLQEAARKTLALARQYYDDALFARVTGVQMRFAQTDEEIAAEWDVTLDFNAGDLNMETVMKKLDVIGKAVLPLDTEGVIDRAGIVEWAMRTIDPAIAARYVRAAEPARNQEREDEQLQFLKISNGVEPEFKEGQNYAIRLQELDKIMQSNPQLQQRYAQDEIFRKLIDSRRQKFQFQLQQRQNALIGRQGAAPVLGGMVDA